MAVQIKRRTWCYRNSGRRTDISIVTRNMKKPRIACDGNIRAEEILSHETMVDDRHMGAGTIEVDSRHHYRGMQDFQTADAI